MTNERGPDQGPGPSLTVQVTPKHTARLQVAALSYARHGLAVFP
jgi:hypothetical protein